MNSWIEIKKSSLIHNYRLFKEFITSEVAVVLKSNAYGHGLSEVYDSLKDEGINRIAVGYLREAKLLRDKGYNGHIFMLTPTFSSDLKEASRLNVEVILGDFTFFEEWKKEEKRPKAHIKIDTGLSRQGFYNRDINTLITKIKESNLEKDIVGCFTHYANVEDVLEQEFSINQLIKFNEASKIFKKEKLNILNHSAASGAALLLKETAGDFIRLGICLYGLWPSKLTRISFHDLFENVKFDLMPVLTWKTKIASIKELDEGSYVGYGCTYKTPKKTLSAVLPIGYFDGFPRNVGEGKSYVLINGKRAPVMGRVSMNLITVNITDIPSAKVNDEVVIIGKDGDEEISAETFAGWGQTINYEIVSRLNYEIPKIVID